MGAAKATTDHNTIRKWAEARGGKPSSVTGTETKNQDAGILRIDFPDRNEPDKLEEISWEEFFAKFEEKKLAFLYQDKTEDGQMSRFAKFVSRDGVH